MESFFTPVEGSEGLYRWDHEKFYESLSPAGKRNWDRRNRAIQLEIVIGRSCPWMRWPVLRVMYTFWPGLIEEGPKQMLMPRWGGMTFMYLNDGMKPTIWHAVRSVVAPGDTPIYPKGAPTLREDLSAWLKHWVSELVYRAGSWA